MEGSAAAAAAAAGGRIDGSRLALLRCGWCRHVCARALRAERRQSIATRRCLSPAFPVGRPRSAAPALSVSDWRGVDAAAAAAAADAHRWRRRRLGRVDRAGRAHLPPAPAARQRSALSAAPTSAPPRRARRAAVAVPGRRGGWCSRLRTTSCTGPELGCGQSTHPLSANPAYKEAARG
eukprot:scaffold569_cov408-Prasinococcus_capsulatus_cf.AAC.1